MELARNASRFYSLTPIISIRLSQNVKVLFLLNSDGFNIEGLADDNQSFSLYGASAFVPSLYRKMAFFKMF